LSEGSDVKNPNDAVIELAKVELTEVRTSVTPPSPGHEPWRMGGAEVEVEPRDDHHADARLQNWSTAQLRVQLAAIHAELQRRGLDPG
jgi:hypothetical protein